jgi:hypothetical protein
VRRKKTGVDSVQQPSTLLQGFLSLKRKCVPCSFHVDEKRPHSRVCFAMSHRVTFSRAKPAFEWIQHEAPCQVIGADQQVFGLSRS